MRKIALLFFTVLVNLTNLCQAQVVKMPAYPLINHDTYFSIWSQADELNAATTKHWTGADHSLLGLIKVDDKFYRFMGKTPPQYRTLAPAGDEKPYDARYVMENKPEDDWYKTDFNDSKWQSGKGPFGDKRIDKGTSWTGRDIWVRRKFSLADIPEGPIYLKCYHDDGAEFYINGKRVAEFKNVGESDMIKMSKNDLQNLKVGENVLAMHCNNTGGGTVIDAGLYLGLPDYSPDNLYMAKQTRVNVTATKTTYSFTCGKIDLRVDFLSPLVLDDLTLLSTPVSYITYHVQANDGKTHDVKLFQGISSALAVNQPNQPINITAYRSGNLNILKAGTQSQQILKRKGDNVRIDWGYLYVTAPGLTNVSQSQTSIPGAEEFFVKGSSASAGPNGTQQMLNTVWLLGNVGGTPQSRVLMLGYDEQFSVQYFGTNLKPWWKQKTSTMNALLGNAYKNRAAVFAKCTATDNKIYTDARAKNGEQYAQLCIMAYRQSIAAHALAQSPQGELLWLSKENFSGGFINTVDVTYPSAPLYLLYNSRLLEGMLNGIFYYSESGKWKKPFAAHDLGTYPQANGQTYGEDMPVEECGNMIILTAAIAKVQHSPAYAKKHWKTLTTWVNYLAGAGFDPENQLCTDDFAGHLAHNANLSVKAIVAIGAYAQLADMLGQKATAQKYRSMAKDMVDKWQAIAYAGDHYALVFKNNESWSQKYNMVWDKVLELNLFPAVVYQREMNFYLKHRGPYGLPLDSRKTYTKSDWIMWTAAMADNKEAFDLLTGDVYKFATETKSRVPLTDWHETKDGTQVGFQARSVVGGYFMKILADRLRR